VTDTDAPPCEDDNAAAVEPVQLEPGNYTDMNLLWRTCQRITVSGNQFVPRALWDKPEAALAAILMGRELGLGDMVALQRIYLIEGKPTLAAELILGLVRRAGHSVTFETRTRERCVITGTRKDNGDTLTVEWTMDDATAAGLTKKDNWRNYPRAMLHARAVTELSRALFSDCVGWAVYTPEDFDVHDGQ
jgi:hypothetical protein